MTQLTFVGGGRPFFLCHNDLYHRHEMLGNTFAYWRYAVDFAKYGEGEFESGAQYETEFALAMEHGINDLPWCSPSDIMSSGTSWRSTLLSSDKPGTHNTTHLPFPYTEAMALGLRTWAIWFWTQTWDEHADFFQQCKHGELEISQWVEQEGDDDLLHKDLLTILKACNVAPEVHAKCMRVDDLAAALETGSPFQWVLLAKLLHSTVHRSEFRDLVSRGTRRGGVVPRFPDCRAACGCRDLCEDKCGCGCPPGESEEGDSVDVRRRLQTVRQQAEFDAAQQVARQQAEAANQSPGAFPLSLFLSVSRKAQVLEHLPYIAQVLGIGGQICLEETKPESGRRRLQSSGTEGFSCEHKCAAWAGRKDTDIDYLKASWPLSGTDYSAGLGRDLNATESTTQLLCTMAYFDYLATSEPSAYGFDVLARTACKDTLPILKKLLADGTGDRQAELKEPRTCKPKMLEA
jgi:hypothetical protein